MKRFLITATGIISFFSIGYLWISIISPYYYAQSFRQELINPVLKDLDLYSPAASNLMLGTAMQESCLGRITGGSPRYVYQIELPTAKDVFTNYLSYRHNLREKLLNFYNPNHDLYWNITENVKFQIALARIIYQRTSAPLPKPNDVSGLAFYWKTYYNTVLGKGKARQFVSIYNHYLTEGYYRCAYKAPKDNFLNSLFIKS